jgi:hypothetical protein
MAINRVRKCTDILEAQAFLNGAVFGGSAGVVSGLVGKTFKLTLPSVKTITFVAAASPPNGDSTALLFKDIKAQIEAVANDVVVSLQNGKICIIEAAIAGGVTVDRTGTSSALLGFSVAVNTVGKVYAPPPSAVAPCWTFIAASQDNSYLVTTWE